MRRLLSALLLSLVATTTNAAEPLIEGDRNVPMNFQRTGLPHEGDAVVAFSGATGVLAWKEGGSGTYSSGVLHSATTFDGGNTWTVVDPRPYPPARQNAPALCAGANQQFYLLTMHPALFGFQQLRLETADLSSGTLVWTRNLVLPGGHTSILYQDIARSAMNSSVHITYTHYDDIESGVASPSRIWYRRSLDDGTTWSSPVILSAEGCERSRVAVGPNGEVYVSWVDAIGESVRLRRSTDGGATFGPERVVAPFLDNRNTGMYQWREPSTTPHAVYTDDMAVPNVPRMVVDRSTGPHRGRLYMTWTDHAQGVAGPALGPGEESEPNNSPETATLVSIGQDLNGFAPNVDLGGDVDYWAFDGVAGQTIRIVGDVDLQPDPGYVESKLYVMFCEGLAGQYTQLARTNTVQHQQEGGPTVYQMKPLILTLPSTGRYYVRMLSSGPYDAAYTLQLREWQVDANSVARDQRDVVLMSSTDGGATWGPKVRVSDAPHRFDESHPEMVVDDLGRLHLTWLDRRNEPACGSLTDQYWAFSFDGGQSFSPGFRVSSGSTTWDHPTDEVRQFPGERNALAVTGPWVVAFWADHRSASLPFADIWGTRMQVGGVVSTAVGRFTAEAAPTGVRIAWHVSDPRGLNSVTVEREQGEGTGYSPLAAQTDNGALEGQHVVYDSEAVAGQMYCYRLAMRFADGRLLHQGPITVRAAEPTLALAWERPTPNPSLGRTRLALSMPSEGRAEVEVFDVAGTRVKRVHSGTLAAGRHAWEWPAQHEPAVPPGIYLVRAEALGRSTATRIVVTR